jgi:hypothetical protein
MFLKLIAGMLAAVLPVPAPSASPHEPKTIITVTSSPYCRSLADHFNGALVPMLANDRTLDGVGVQLDGLDTMFDEPNYVQQFLHSRDAIGHQEATINRSLPLIQGEINQLRLGAQLTTDPQAISQIHDAAQDLQAAYDKQRQLSIDLHNMYISLLQINPSRLHHTLGGFDEQDMIAPADSKSLKSYLRFNGQRDVISLNEDRATDLALTAADKYCSPK